MQDTLDSEGDTRILEELQGITKSAEHIAEKSPNVPRSVHSSVDEQTGKRMDNLEKAKAVMTPRQARRVAAKNGKDIDRDFREKDGSYELVSEQQLRFLDDDKKEVFKKGHGMGASALGKSANSSEAVSNESLIEEILVSKKNRNRGKSESYSVTVDNSKKPRSHSIDALDLEDLGDYVRNVAKSLAMRNNADQERGGHKVKKHKMKSKSKADSVADSESNDDDSSESVSKYLT